MVLDVPALMEGRWTDSLQQTGLYYTKKALERYADNWVDRSLWTRHTGGKPRGIEEKIGEVENPRYKEIGGRGAVLVDLHLFGNPKGLEAQYLVKNGYINYVSVEHGGEESYNYETRQLESASLVFTGIALVSQGACRTCTIAAATDAELKARENNFFVMVPNESSIISLNNDLMENDMELKELGEAELKVALEAMQKQLAEVQAQMKAQTEQAAQAAKIQADVQAKAQAEALAATKAQAEAAEKQVAEVSQSLAAAQAEIDKLRKTPLPPTTLAPPAVESTTEVSAEPPVKWDRKRGIIEANY